MKKHTLIETLYDEEQHAYVVTIGTDIGEFTGATQCREEDYKHEAKYFGFMLAEIKANIEYAKAKRNYWEAQIKALSSFWKNMEGTRSYDANAYWVKKIHMAIEEAKNKRKYWANEITQLKQNYYMRVVSVDAASKNLKRKGIKL